MRAENIVIVIKAVITKHIIPRARVYVYAFARIIIYVRIRTCNLLFDTADRCNKIGATIRDKYIQLFKRLITIFASQ